MFWFGLFFSREILFLYGVSGASFGHLHHCTFPASHQIPFYFFKHSKKILNQTDADRQICFIFIGKTQWKQRSPGWPGFGKGTGTEAEGAEAPSRTDANNALSEAHNEPIENTELFGKIPNCEKYAHVAVESQLAQVTPAHIFFKVYFSFIDSETRDHYHPLI